MSSSMFRGSTESGIVMEIGDLSEMELIAYLLTKLFLQTHVNRTTWAFKKITMIRDKQSM